jgi:hypothetical protein
VINELRVSNLNEGDFFCLNTCLSEIHGLRLSGRYSERKKTKQNQGSAEHTREVRTKKKPAKRRAFELLNKMFNARVHLA